MGSTQAVRARGHLIPTSAWQPRGRQTAQQVARIKGAPQRRKVLIIGQLPPNRGLRAVVNFRLPLTLPVSSVSRLSPWVQISRTEPSTTQSPITAFRVSKIKRNQVSRNRRIYHRVAKGKAAFVRVNCVSAT